MQNNEQKNSKSSLITPSGKQIVLRNDLERLFTNRNAELTSPAPKRETPQENRNAVYFATPGELDFRSLNSPMMLGLNYSPFRPSGVNFFETFSRRFQGKFSPEPPNMISNTLNAEKKTQNSVPTSKFEGIIPDHIETYEKQLPVKKQGPQKSQCLSPLKEEAESNELINEHTDTPQNSPIVPGIQIFRSPILANEKATAKIDQTAPLLSAEETNRLEKLDSKPINPIYFNCDITKYGGSLLKLKDLFRVLNKVFNHKAVELEEYTRLVAFEEELLNSILQRKFMKKLRGRDFELEAWKKVELINEIILTKSHKRPEECYKFILTRVIKHLKKHIKSTGVPTKDLEEHFYQIYFSRTARELGLPITDFHYPLTGNKAKFKLNSRYFERIFRSKIFMEKLTNYLSGMLEQDYRVEIAKKLESLLVRWDNILMQSSAESAAAEGVIKEYVLKNKRCKLPWTMHEVLESIERFKALLRTFPFLAELN